VTRAFSPCEMRPEFGIVATALLYSRHRQHGLEARVTFVPRARLALTGAISPTPL
jgi:hypothetical protein